MIMHFVCSNCKELRHTQPVDYDQEEPQSKPCDEGCGEGMYRSKDHTGEHVGYEGWKP